MIIVLPCRFQECFRPFTILPVEGSFEMRLFRHFGVCNFLNTSAMKDIFLSKSSKFNPDFKNKEQNREHFFLSYIVASELIMLKLSLLRREYLSSAVNILTNSLKVLHIAKKYFIYFNYLQSDD